MFVEPSRSTCTWVEKCVMSTPPSEILWPKKDSTWISISNRSAWNKGGVPTGSRPCKVRPSNRTCKASHWIWKLPSSTRAPVAFSISRTIVRRAHRSASPLPTMYASVRPAATASVAAKAIPCFKRNFLFLSLIFTRMIYRASGLPAGRCYFDLQVRFGFIQPFRREAGDRALREQFADLSLDVGQARRRLIFLRQLRQQFFLIVSFDIGGFDLHRRAKLVIDITLDINLPREHLPDLLRGKPQLTQLGGIRLGTSELRGEQPVVALRASFDQLLECPKFAHLAQQNDVAFDAGRDAIDHAPRLLLRHPARDCRRGCSKQQDPDEDGGRAPHQNVVPRLMKNWKDGSRESVVWQAAAAVAGHVPLCTTNRAGLS